MEVYQSREAYLKHLAATGILPSGFKVSTVPLEFSPQEKKSREPYRMNLTFLQMDEPTDSFGALFTRNRFPGAPVIVGREMLEQSEIQGILVNNRIANVCAPDGVGAARRLAHAAAKAAGMAENAVFPSSTGIIGWKLPEMEMAAAIPKLVTEHVSHNALDLAKAIMTTDSFPKLRSVRLGEGSIVAVVKGAGMIEPNMATMLCYVMTDLDVDRTLLRSALKEAVDLSFNRMSVDSDQSTSDSVIMLSSKKKPMVDEALFRQELISLLSRLSEDVVRNGEGTAHVMNVSVKGFDDDSTALSVAKAIVNSPLVKSAVFGNDPNVGRLLSAAGDFCGNTGVELDPAKVVLTIGGEVVYREGSFLLDEEKEERLYEYMKSCALPVPSPGYPIHSASVDVELEVPGKGRASVFGSDLSYEYVRENAEYRS